VATRLDPTCEDPYAAHIIMVEKFAQHADEYDLAHFHIDYLHFPLMRRLGIPFVTALHGRLDLPDLDPLYREFDDAPVVSISDDQRTPLPFANWQGTVHHGLPVGFLRPGGVPREPYLAFVGRASPEKGLDDAIRIARRAGWKIRIAAKIDRSHKPYREYFDNVVEPLLKEPHVEFLGEVNEAGKRDLLQHASALLFPIKWPEPFGLVMLEAFACGTPVIAYRRGSVPEVIDEGVTGFVVDTEDEAVRAIGRLASLDPSAVRAVFERRFTARQMAENYLRIYRKLLAAATMTTAQTFEPMVDGPSLSSGVPTL
jgi:glycosyltransferase involved in cell wall biosynthesis